MNTTELFGIQFALKNRFKAQIIEDFDRWKSEKQWFLTEERNKRKLFEQVLKNHTEQHPKDYRPPEDVASELWEKLRREAARTNWQQVYEEVLGSDYELPNDQGPPHITKLDIKDLLFESNCRHYCFTDTAVQECEKVHITEPLDMEWLSDSTDGKRQINFGNHFIRYQKRGNRIIALAASFTRRQECNYLQHTFLVFNLKKQEALKHYDPITDLIREQYEKEVDDYAEAKFENKSRRLLYNMITFLDLIPVKQITLPAGRCLEPDAESSNQESVVNNSEDIPITMVTVNANWNYSVYIEETEVTGYWREYLCGKGKTKVIKRYVKSYHRPGYERGAQKLKAART